jgi:hypothetical protein
MSKSCLAFCDLITVADKKLCRDILGSNQPEPVFQHHSWQYCGPQQLQYRCFEAETTMSSCSTCRREQPHIVICLRAPLTLLCSGEMRRITREPLIRVQQPTSTNKQRSSCMYLSRSRWWDPDSRVSRYPCELCTLMPCIPSMHFGIKHLGVAWLMFTNKC